MICLSAWAAGLTNETVHLWNNSYATAVTQEIAEDETAHIAMIWNATDSRYDIFINGHYVNSHDRSETGAAGLLSSVSTFIIGTDSAAYHYDGQLSDFRIYDHSLTPAELRDIAKYPNNGLLAHYKFQGDDRDYSGNGYHGSVYAGKEQAHLVNEINMNDYGMLAVKNTATSAWDSGARAYQSFPATDGSVSSPVFTEWKYHLVDPTSDAGSHAVMAGISNTADASTGAFGQIQWALYCYNMSLHVYYSGTSQGYTGYQHYVGATYRMEWDGTYLRILQDGNVIWTDTPTVSGNLRFRIAVHSYGHSDGAYNIYQSPRSTRVSYSDVWDDTKAVQLRWADDSWIVVNHNGEMSRKVFGTERCHTISAWINLSSWSNYGSLINKMTGASWSNTTNGVWTYSAGIRHIAGTNEGGNPTNSVIAVTESPTLNEWHHFCAVSQGKFGFLYIDGQFISICDYDVLYKDQSENQREICIGPRYLPSSGSEGFPGKIYDLRIYSEPLSPNIIRALAHSPFPTKKTEEMISNSKSLMLDFNFAERAEVTYNNYVNNVKRGDYEELAVGSDANFTTAQAGAGSYVGVVDTFAHEGEKSLRFVSGTDSYKRIYYTLGGVSAGTWMSISAWVYNTDPSLNVYLHMEANGGDYTWGIPQDRNYHHGTGWERLWCRINPATTSVTDLYMYINNKTSGNEIFIDEFLCESNPIDHGHTVGYFSNNVRDSSGWPFSLKNDDGLGRRSPKWVEEGYNSVGAIEFPASNATAQTKWNSSKISFGPDPILTVAYAIKRTGDISSGKATWGLGSPGSRCALSSYVNAVNSIGIDYYGSPTYKADYTWPVNEWIYVVVVKNQTGLTHKDGHEIYIDGVKQDITVLRSGAYQPTLLEGLCFGGIHSTETNYYAENFVLGDFKVFRKALSHTEIQELTEKMAAGTATTQVDREGNLYIDKPIVSKMFSPALALNHREWCVSERGSHTSWVRNGDATENSIVRGRDPWGKFTHIWVCTPDANSNGDGGWNTFFPIDKDYHHRFSVWIQKAGNVLAGSTYLGCYNNANFTQDLAGTGQTNHYFIVGDPPASDQWYLYVGYIHKAGATSDAFGVSGYVYDTAGNIVQTHTRTRVRTVDDIQRFRCYLYYCTDTSVRQYMCYPRVDRIDGTEPDISDLINGLSSMEDEFMSRYPHILRDVTLEDSIVNFGKLKNEIANLDMKFSGANGLKGHYPLQYNTNLFAGQYQPTVHSNIAYELEDGYPCAHFTTQTTSKLSFEEMSCSSSDPWSASIWVKEPASAVDTQRIFLGLEDAYGPYFQLLDNNKFLFRFWESPYGYYYVSNAIVDRTQWNQFTVTWGGASSPVFRIYINGELDNTHDVTGDTQYYPSAHFDCIGPVYKRAENHPEYDFTGWVRDFRFYTEELSALYVKQLHHATESPFLGLNNTGIITDAEVIKEV